MDKVSFQITVLKMGPKLGIYFSKGLAEKTKLKKGDLIEINFTKSGKNFVFLSKFNSILTLRTEIIDYLNLKEGDKINGEINILKNTERTSNLFQDNKIDLLYLIPSKTSRGYDIIVKLYKKDNEDWLNIWCTHKRGSCMQINLRRFVDIDPFGRFLGLIQAEGTKKTRYNLEFANASLTEHQDFIGYLNHLGIDNSLINVDCVYYNKIKNAKEVIKNYEHLNNIKIRNIYSGLNSKYGLGFKLRVRSVILTNIILDALDNIRKTIVDKVWDERLRLLSECFFAKLLSGDGNINLDTKDRILPQGRVKITDCNLSYLKDYKVLMEKFGFHPKIDEKYIIVRSSFKLEQAKFLLQIGAFKNNPNEARLRFFINSRKNLSG